MPLAPLTLARLVVDAASDKQAADILLLDVRSAVNFTDYLVIMSAESVRQMNALEEDLQAAARQEGSGLYRREGTAESGWLLLDFVDVVVHIFTPDQRDLYQLEQLWAKAKPVVRIQ